MTRTNALEPENADLAATAAVTRLDPDRLEHGRLRASAYRNAPFLSGCVIIAILLVGSFVVPWLSSHDPWVAKAEDTLLPPGGGHLFGTDESGFDIFTRVFYAPRVDLVLAVLGVAIGALVGIVVGVTAGFSRGAAAGYVMRLADLLQAFPLLILALAIVAIAGDSKANVVAAIAFINAPMFMRLVRTRVLSVREHAFVEAAEALGNPRRRIVFVHVLPNSIGPVIVQFGLALGYAILVLAALAFLGVGVQAPTPEWGSMIRTGSVNLTTGQWWTFTFPGVFLALAVAGFNLISEGVNAAREM